MRFHLPALPGQPITKANSTCAFTGKVRKFAEMMVPRGHEVIIYGDPVCEANVTEHIPCYPSCEPPEFTPGAWMGFNGAAAEAIQARAQEGDFLLIAMGECQRSLAEELPLMAVEYGIGYGGCFAPFKVFESYAWMHTCYGQQRGSNTADGSFYDAVIPNYFEAEDFPFNPEPRDDYLLYVGRLEERKGVQIAVETAERVGMKLVLAGAGPYPILPGYGEPKGIVGPEERGELMAEARALMCPTIYVEPFGGVAVEAMLCGTPVISTDWGAFTETVIQGVTGYRCHRLAEFVWAADAVSSLDPQTIRDYAVANFSMDAIAPRYEAYFSELQTLAGRGWYDENWDPSLHHPRGITPPHSPVRTA